MQILHYLPTQQQLALNPVVPQSVVDLLIEPFGSREKAIEFWVHYASKIVVLDQYDDDPQSLASLDDITRHFIEQAEHTPEFIENLPQNYQLSFPITDDEGRGLYLIKPANIRFSKGTAYDE
jgi:hypothetical protein